MLRAFVVRQDIIGLVGAVILLEHAAYVVAHGIIDALHCGEYRVDVIRHAPELDPVIGLVGV